jgi:hypothetical protein
MNESDYRRIVLDEFNPFLLKKVTDAVYDIHEKTSPNRKVGQIMQLRPNDIAFSAEFTAKDLPRQAIRDEFFEYILINPLWRIKPS